MHLAFKLAALAAPLAMLAGTPVLAQVSAGEIADKLNMQKTRGLQLHKSTPSDPSAGGSSQSAATEQPVAVETQPKQQQKVQQASVAPQEPIDYGDDAEINLTVAFAFDSAVLLPEAKVQLDELCKAMKAVDIDKFNIYGHTDASGSVQYNLTLSQARANEVKRYLSNDCGLSPDRIEAIGMGETKLYDASRPNAPENRRVEVQVGA